MGGQGSGRWYRWDTKTTIDTVHRLDIRYMRQQGTYYSRATMGR